MRKWAQEGGAGLLTNPHVPTSLIVLALMVLVVLVVLKVLLVLMVLPAGACCPQVTPGVGPKGSMEVSGIKYVP